MDATAADLSSDESMDEEEAVKNFDEAADLIVEKTCLPKKSGDRYLLVYNAYKKWKDDNKNLLSKSNNEESNLIVYFNQLKEKVKPPTMWSI